MEVKETIEKLESSKEFDDWKKKGGDSFLCHVFKMMDQPNQDIWQIGYYNSKTNTITTFVLENDNITSSPESEVFKKEDTKIQPLDSEKIKIDMKEALHLASDFQKEKYSGEEPTKVIAILQHLALGQVYNITFITRTFNTLNMKISSEDGKVLEHKLTPMMDFANVEKGGKDSPA